MLAWSRRKDTHGVFQSAPFQEAPTPPMTPDIYSACERAVHVVTIEGRVLKAGRATLFVLERIGWGRFARLLSYPPLVWLVEIGYWIFAHSRKFFALFMFRRVSDD